jgi:hypothetical protein
MFINQFENLSDEIRLLIMNELCCEELLILRSVSKKWLHLTRDYSLEKKFNLLQWVVVNPHPCIKLESRNILSIRYLSNKSHKGTLQFIKENRALRSREAAAIEEDAKQLARRGFYLSPFFHFPTGWNLKDKESASWDIFRRLVKEAPCGHFHFEMKAEILPTDKSCIRLTPFQPEPRSKEDDHSSSPQDRDAPLQEQ